MGNADADATAYNKNGMKRGKELFFFIYLNGEKYFGVAIMDFCSYYIL
jgi:hypothetical protein